MKLLLFTVGIIIGAVAGYLAYERMHVVTLEDDVPSVENKKNNVLKLQNELAEHVKVENNKVKIKVVK